MPIALINKSSGADNGTSSLIVNSLSVPSGTILIFSVCFRGGTGITLTVPSGWNLIRRGNSTTVLGQASYWKLDTGGEPSSYTWGLTTSQKLSWSLLAFEGVDNITPVDASSVQNNASSTTITAATISTSLVNTMLVGLFGTATGTTIATYTTPLVEQTDESSGGGSATTRTTMSSAIGIQSGIGASGNKTAVGGAAAVKVCLWLWLRT
jgi:hypothetical protein